MSRAIPPCSALMLAIVGLASTARGDDLADKLTAAMDSPGYRNGRWGVLVVDAETGRTVFEKAADQLFRPASVTKLFSGAAALVELGADHRFRTPVVRRGEVDESGTLKGDLILVAQGDLALGGRTGPEGTLLFVDNDHTYAGSGVDGEVVAADPLAGLDFLAREVHEAGIRAVTGEVWIDDRLFPQAPSSGSGPRRVSPIVVNDNVIDVVVEPGPAAGGPARARAIPASPSIPLDVQVETVPAGGKARIDGRLVGGGLTLRGQVPAGHPPILRSVPVDDPARFARTLFIEALRRRGVKVSASPLADNEESKLPGKAEVAALPKVAEYTSPPLSEYLKVILKVSHNLHASTLPVLLALKHGEENLSAGLRRQGQALQGLGVEPEGVSFGGGAGGSPADLVTPRATVTLLRAMAARKADGPAYASALPILGRDGTLAKHVPPESPAKGHVRAKSGTFWVVNELTGKAVLTSKAMAGYLETAGGRPLVFAIFLNDLPLDATPETVGEATLAAGRLLGRIGEILYQGADTSPR